MGGHQKRLAVTFGRERAKSSRSEIAHVDDIEQLRDPAWNFATQEERNGAHPAIMQVPWTEAVCRIQQDSAQTSEACVKQTRLNQLLYLEIGKSQADHLCAKLLPRGAGSNQTDEGTNVCENGIMPQDGIDNPRSTYFCGSERVLLRFQAGEYQVHRIWPGAINHQIMAGKPPVELSRSVSIAGKISYWQFPQVKRSRGATSTRGDCPSGGEQRSRNRVADVAAGSDHKDPRLLGFHASCPLGSDTWHLNGER